MRRNLVFRTNSQQTIICQKVAKHGFSLENRFLFLRTEKLILKTILE